MCLSQQGRERNILLTKELGNKGFKEMTQNPSIVMSYIEVIEDI